MPDTILAVNIRDDTVRPQAHQPQNAVSTGPPQEARCATQQPRPHAAGEQFVLRIGSLDNITVVAPAAAIKYRSLAAAESSIPLDARDDLAAYVVAYDTGGTQAAELAAAYNVRRHAVDRELVLAPGE